MIIITLLLILLVYYLIKSIGLCYVFKVIGYDNAGLAFVPFIRMYMLSCTTPCYEDDKVYITPKIGLPKWIFRFWWLIGILLPILLPGVGFILALILYFMCFIRIVQYLCSQFENKREEYFYWIAFASAFLSIIFYVKCFIYMILRKKPKEI